MAVAYFAVHSPRGPWPIINRGEAAAFLSFTLLYLAARGGGEFSLEGVLRNKA